MHSQQFLTIFSEFSITHDASQPCLFTQNMLYLKPKSQFKIIQHVYC